MLRHAVRYAIASFMLVLSVFLILPRGIDVVICLGDDDEHVGWFVRPCETLPMADCHSEGASQAEHFAKDGEDGDHGPCLDIVLACAGSDAIQYFGYQSQSADFSSVHLFPPVYPHVHVLFAQFEARPSHAPILPDGRHVLVPPHLVHLKTVVLLN
ncbi:MAG: hypothetical protein FWC40_10150 [Proteobacteria bacterium]|nr:hypothetical protein [Pseudomonadota bacterium]